MYKIILKDFENINRAERFRSPSDQIIVFPLDILVEKDRINSRAFVSQNQAKTIIPYFR